MEQGKEYSLPSGSVLLVSRADFGDANRLKNEVLRAFKGQGVGELDLAKLKEVFTSANPAKSAVLLNTLVDRVMTLASSDEVEAAIFKCATRSVYKAEGKDQNVTRKLFDDADIGERARGDYFVICARIIEVNVGPFFAPIFSAFEARTRNGVGAPKSS